MKISSKKKTKEQKSSGMLLAGSPVQLVPRWVFYPLIFVSLALPNLIFSGVSWFDTLHIMKWAWTMVPVALISLIGGSILALYGAERTGFRLDLFGGVWFSLLAFVSLQPLWADIFALSTYMKEWFFFATLLAAYIFCYNLFTGDKALRCLLWLANLNAAVNIIFAELLIRDLNGPFWFIMNVPGNYIGNTGQQEMFGLWMAMAAMNGIFLHMVYSQLSETEAGKYRNIKYANLVMLAFNSWGLWNSTTRAGMLSLMTGTIILSVIIWNCKPRKLLKNVGFAALLVAVMLVVNICMGYFGWSRAYALINKTSDMLMNTANFGARREIWITSWNVIKKHPIAGVGLGHYKWHYLEGQREAFRDHPDMKWQFTYWAHSEYLQWMAEFGIFGTLILLGAAAWWIWSFVRALTQKKDLSYAAMWGCAVVYLIWFDAIFSRPFHRIENIVWLPLAFALSNRQLLPSSVRFSEIRHGFIYRLLGLFFAVVAVVGMFFLYSGCRADKYLRAATMTNSASLQRYRIDEARRSLMGKDEANEQLAYHLLAVANATKKPEDLAAGIEQLYRSFHTRPQAKQLMELINLAQRTGNQRLLSELARYLHPTAYGSAPGSAAPLSK
ncbi:O-antigen ligase family protein [Cloacibacillus evryensis]|uniref:O-antigen ligase family protein n=1 Tax=Cloacibacillus evryensis TaxID=508460 RepID=A0AAW5K274_9BACT|nr:O-antigen ligase family protein [Cloacibacillus evryensis]MCQ4814052.1 O-antigen ligase family protein [Cloacibacillus evryensis]